MSYLSPSYSCNHISSKNSVAPNNAFSTSNSVVLKADSGASGNFLKSKDKHILRHRQKITNGPIATLPDQSTISPEEHGHLPIDHVSDKATSSLVYPKLSNSSLLSIGQMCDDDCIAIFTKKFLHILKDDKIILQGYRNLLDGLWDIPL